MQQTLLTVGLVCLIAAIVGGGLKLLGNELPVVQSIKRQFLLGGFGSLLVAMAVLPDITRQTDISPPVETASAPAVETETLTERLHVGTEIAQAQVNLSQLGYYSGHSDGVGGKQTLQAIKSFQSDNGLQVTGKLDQPTIAKLVKAVQRKTTEEQRAVN